MRTAGSVAQQLKLRTSLSRRDRLKLRHRGTFQKLPVCDCDARGFAPVHQLWFTSKRKCLWSENDFETDPKFKSDGIWQWRKKQLGFPTPRDTWKHDGDRSADSGVSILLGNVNRLFGYHSRSPWFELLLSFLSSSASTPSEVKEAARKVNRRHYLRCVDENNGQLGGTVPRVRRAIKGQHCEDVIFKTQPRKPLYFNKDLVPFILEFT